MGFCAGYAQAASCTSFGARTLKVHLIRLSTQNRALYTDAVRPFRTHPLTLEVLASLTPSHFEVTASYGSANSVEPEVPNDTDLVGVSLITPFAPDGYALADKLRKKGFTVVLGGPHPTLMPQEAGMHADAVVIGEAEGVWSMLLHDARNGDLKTFYDGRGSCDLAQAPPPRHDLFPETKWGLVATTYATRGCPRRCAYCVVPQLYNRYQARPVEQVLAEIASLKRCRFGSKRLMFWDDNLMNMTDYASRLFAGLADLDVKWLGQATMDFAQNPKLLRLAAKSGCCGLFVGLESVNGASLAEAHKWGNKVQQYSDCIARFHEHGIAVACGVMFGFDNDDKCVFEKTLHVLEKLRIEAAAAYILTPFPGTALFDQLERQGRILHRDWSKYDEKNVVFEPKRMSPRELQEGFALFRKEFFSWSATLKRLVRSAAPLWLSAPFIFGARMYWKRSVAAGQGVSAGPACETAREGPQGKPFVRPRPVGG